MGRNAANTLRRKYEEVSEALGVARKAAGEDTMDAIEAMRASRHET